MEIEHIRKINLLCLLEEGGRGYAKELAELIDCEPSYLSQIKTDKKNMGSAFARQMESALNLEKGWMDVAHPARYSKKLKMAVNFQLGYKLGTEIQGKVSQAMNDPYKVADSSGKPSSMVIPETAAELFEQYGFLFENLSDVERGKVIGRLEAYSDKQLGLGLTGSRKKNLPSD